MMRPRSMTGFGRGKSNDTDQSWVVETRTVNHRFLDQRIVLPSAFSPLEERIKKTVAKRQDRGKVDVYISYRGENASGASLPVVDIELARRYHTCLLQLNEELGIEIPVQLNDLLAQRGIIAMQERNPDLDQEWPLIEKALLGALTECTEMREREGQALKDELNSRLDVFASIVQKVEEAVPHILKQRQQELKERLTKLLTGIGIDPARLAQESAIMADKADITEELIRLASHISQFRSFLESEEPIGRRLDFLLQEFLREVNTLASKISNATAAHLGVELKNEVEKLREQVQNLE